MLATARGTPQIRPALEVWTIQPRRKNILVASLFALALAIVAGLCSSLLGFNRGMGVLFLLFLATGIACWSISINAWTLFMTCATFGLPFVIMASMVGLVVGSFFRKD